jgi:hypothetical protein
VIKSFYEFEAMQQKQQRSLRKIAHLLIAPSAIPHIHLNNVVNTYLYLKQ